MFTQEEFHSVLGRINTNSTNIDLGIISLFRDCTDEQFTELCTALSRCENVEDLNLRGAFLGKTPTGVQLQSLTNALELCTKLTKIDLSYNDWGYNAEYRDLAELLQTLSGLPNLDFVNLNGNQICDDNRLKEDIKFILPKLGKFLRQIRSVDLRGNNITALDTKTFGFLLNALADINTPSNSKLKNITLDDDIQYHPLKFKVLTSPVLKLNILGLSNIGLFNPLQVQAIFGVISRQKSMASLEDQEFNFTQWQTIFNILTECIDLNMADFAEILSIESRETFIRAVTNVALPLRKVDLSTYHGCLPVEAQELLIKCKSIDVLNLNRETIASLEDFVRQQVFTIQEYGGFMRLDLPKIKEIFYCAQIVYLLNKNDIDLNRETMESLEEFVSAEVFHESILPEVQAYGGFMKLDLPEVIKMLDYARIVYLMTNDDIVCHYMATLLYSESGFIESTRFMLDNMSKSDIIDMLKCDNYEQYCAFINELVINEPTPSNNNNEPTPSNNNSAILFASRSTLNNLTDMTRVDPNKNPYQLALRPIYGRLYRKF